MRRTTILTLVCVVFLAASAWADPVKVATEQSPLQDDWTLEDWVEELSTNPHSDGQLIESWLEEWDLHIPCSTDFEDNGNPTVQVAIQNLTNRYFTDLYYVGDVHDDGSFETTFTNVDELVADVTFAGTPAPGLAFKIDAIGLNTPLVYESMTQDQIFEPGEIWEFVIQEYNNTLGLSAAALGSVGPAPYGAIAQASALDEVSSGSIIPEPATLCLLGVGAVAILRRKK